MLLLQAQGNWLPTKAFTLAGMGAESCATAFSPAYESRTEDWVLGFFSGLNAASGKNVGQGTDAEGLVGEVRLACQSKPSAKMVEAALKAYRKMESR